jgi:phage baseplate assembly protein W
MAIKDTSKKPYIVDNDSNIKVGIDLPIRRGDDKDGWFATSKTTMEAVKNNIKNLLNTNVGERFMQPNLGTNLRSILFEQIDDTTIVRIQDMILDSLKLWLPFVEVRDIKISTNDDDKVIGDDEVRVIVIFNIKQNPNTLDSVTIDFSGDINNSVDSSLGGY